MMRSASRTTMLKFALLVLVITVTLLIPVSLCQERVCTISKFYVYKIDDVITRATYEELKDIMSKIENDSALIVVLDTPGGDLEATIAIVRMFENSHVPIIGFVYPRGAYAWSAGTLILVATHIAAMSPGTVIGSCQPIAIDILTGQATPVNNSKVVNAIMGYFMEAARLTGKNETFVRECVLHNLNLDAEKAVKYKVVNFIARDFQDLISKLNGTKDKLLNCTLIVKPGYVTINVEHSLMYKVRTFFSNPLVLQSIVMLGFILVLAGVLTGLVALAGVGIALIISAFLLTLLPLNVASLVLLALGLVLLLVDVISGFATHGVCAGLGTIFTIVGLLLTVPNISPPKFYIVISPQTTMILLYTTVGIVAGVLATMIYFVAKVYRRRPYSEIMLTIAGKRGIAVENIPAGQTGYVKIGGEYWRVKALEDIREGDEVIIVGQEGDIPLARRAREER